MSETELDYYQKAVVENGKWVDGVLISGAVLAGVVVMTKLIGTTEFEIQNVKFPVEYAWAVFTVFSGVHFYTAWLLNRATFRLWNTHSTEKCLATFQEVTTTGGVFVRGLIPRTRLMKTTWGIKIYEMRLDDPSTWATHALALLLIAGIVPFDVSDPRRFWGFLFLAVVISAANWFIGSMWLVPLSELAIPHKESTILAGQAARSRANPVVKDTSSNFPVLFKGIVPLFSAVLTMAGALLVPICVFAAGMGYSSLESFGLGAVALKTIVAVVAILVVPRLVRKSLQIERYGKTIFVALFLLLSSAIIAIYLAWI